MVAVGIDISKQKIDVWTQDNLTTLANEKAVIRRFFKRFVGQEVQIVMEATGRYHRLTHEVLSELGLSVMVINPFQSRHFARALHVLCKTDKVDAKMLCLFAERMEYIPTPVLEENHRQLMDLIRHVDDLKSTRHGLIVRLKEATLAFVEASLKRSIETLDIEDKVWLVRDPAHCRRGSTDETKTRDPSLHPCYRLAHSRDVAGVIEPAGHFNTQSTECSCWGGSYEL